MVVLVFILLFTNTRQLPMMLAILGIGVVYYKISQPSNCGCGNAVNSGTAVAANSNVYSQYPQEDGQSQQRMYENIISIPRDVTTILPDYPHSEYQGAINVDDKLATYRRRPNGSVKHNQSEMLNEYHRQDVEADEYRPWYRTE